MESNFNFKYYKESKLILAIIILYTGSEFLIELLNSVLSKYDINYNRFYPATILLAIIFGLINSFLHKIPWLWKFLIKVPLIRGVYEGEIIYFIKGVELRKSCEMKIRQTVSKIKIDTKFFDVQDGVEIIKTKTPSKSLIEDFVKNESDVFELHYYYRNSGSIDGEIPVKMGYNVLEYCEDEKKLEGVYFARKSWADGNSGELKVKFKNKLK